MTLPLETINGKQYQPVAVSENDKNICSKCCFSTFEGHGCNLQMKTIAFECTDTERYNGDFVYFIEPGDTNEQEKIKQES